MTTNIFEPAGVDLVIAGHSHFYQHNVVHNLHHLVVGTAGAPLYVPTTASYTIRSVQDYNYAIMDVTSSTLHLTVYNSSDNILDTLQFSKPSTNVDDNHAVPTDFRLMQNYPNPWNPTTIIRYALPQTSLVMLTVNNTLGQQVSQLVNEQQSAGYHDVVFNDDGLASGVYFYRLQAGDYVATKKLVLLR